MQSGIPYEHTIQVLVCIIQHTPVHHTLQEGLVVERTPANGKATRTGAASIAENTAEEGESSDDGIVPNEHNNGSNYVNELQRGSTTNNGEGCDTLEYSPSKGEDKIGFQHPRTRQCGNSGITVMSRVAR